MTKTVAGSVTTYAFPNSSGGSSQFSVTTASYSAHTNFMLTTPVTTECSTSCTLIMAQSLSLPNGTSYSFTYDSGTTTGNYGILKSMTLPTGGVVNYVYQNVYDTVGVNRRVSSRTVTPTTGSPGTWNYSAVKISGNWQVTVTKPSGDNEVHGFTLSGTVSNWHTSVASYTGAVAPANLQRTVTNTYDFSHELPLATVTTLPSGLNSRVEYDFDSSNINFGNVTQIKRWNFYTGTLPTNPDRKTTIAYLATSPYSAKNITGLPISVTETDGTGATWLSQVNYSYDTTTLASGTTGVIQHDDTNFGSTNTVRGNLTEVDRLLASGATCPSSTCLQSLMTYDITGQLRSSQDPNGSSTGYSYTDNFFTDNGANPPAAFTPTQATNAFLTQVTPPISGLVTTYGYYYGSGKPAVSTDPNGATSYSHYQDLLDRLTASVDPLGNVTTTTYTGNTVSESALSFNGGASVVDSRTTLDSLGRSSLQQILQGPGLTSYDTSETDYDTSGRPNRKTIAYAGTAGQTNATAAATTTTYDGLSRSLLVTDPGTGTLSSTYSSNDVLQTVGPAPTGENAKSKQIEYNGLGRLSSVCEVTTGTLSGTCSQATTKTGYWTKYTYAIASGTQTTTVTQNTQ